MLLRNRVVFLVKIVVLELYLNFLLKQLVFSLLDRIVLVILGEEALIWRITDPGKLTLEVRGDPKVVVHLPKHFFVKTLVQLRIWDE